MVYSTRQTRKNRWYIDRISLLKWFMILFFVVILGRLFQLQILDYQEYSTYAQQRMKDKIITASRGRILLKDGENEYFELANNVSLELLFGDPYLIQQRIEEKAKLQVEKPERAAAMDAPLPSEIAQKLAPLLFGMIKEQSTSCDENPLCISQALEEAFFSKKRYLQQEEYKKQQLLDPDFKIPEEVFRDEEELLQEYISDLTESLSRTDRDYVVLKTDLGTETIKAVQDLVLPGITTTESTVAVNPQKVIEATASAVLLEPILEVPIADLEYLLSPRPNRYVKILNRIDFETAQQIRILGITGLGFYDEHWRNYAEQEGNPFAPQVIGFVDNSFNPVYGLEKSMNDILSGETGHIRGEVDLRGRTLTARSSQIEQAVNGTDIVLTLDQVIQNKVEELLEERVKASNARSGEVIIQDPSTGAILAMAMYPSFNLNLPGGAYEKESLPLTQEQIDSLEVIENDGEKNYFLYYNPGYKIEVFRRGEDEYFRYKNKEGIRVYRNSTVSDIYEPGSVFKSIVMAAAIDSKEVLPSDIFHDTEPLQVDCHMTGLGETRRKMCDYTIKNSTNQYYGLVTMTEILEKSLNTGMAFISKKLGPSLMYDYLKNFGFGEKTFIESPDEQTGKLTHYRNWNSESDMITKAFGQGIAATPIQVINAFSAVINGGLLMQPTLIAGTLDEEGNFVPQEPTVVRRVITADSSEIMKSMLVSSVKRGVAKRAAIEKYLVGGKTGTSQIASRGVYEKGVGSTIGSFAGFVPYENPRFSILIKIDRPRTSEWGETNAVPLFKDLTTFLLNYLQVPPDDIHYEEEEESVTTALQD
ncbi:MAG: penicillin-binding protein 2 [bacterium]|nr:penicillin-binding protein 2 [bacterium]